MAHEQGNPDYVVTTRHENPMGALFGCGNYQGRSAERATVNKQDGVFAGVSVGVWDRYTPIRSGAAAITFTGIIRPVIELAFFPLATWVLHNLSFTKLSCLQLRSSNFHLFTLCLRLCNAMILKCGLG